MSYLYEYICLQHKALHWDLESRQWSLHMSLGLGTLRLILKTSGRTHSSQGTQPTRRSSTTPYPCSWAMTCTRSASLFSVTVSCLIIPRGATCLMLVKCRRNSNEVLTEPPAASKEILGIPHPDCFEEKFRESLIDCIRCIAAVDRSLTAYAAATRCAFHATKPPFPQ